MTYLPAAAELDTLYNLATQLRDLAEHGRVTVYPETHYIGIDAEAARDLLDLIDAAIGVRKG